VSVCVCVSSAVFFFFSVLHLYIRPRRLSILLRYDLLTMGDKEVATRADSKSGSASALSKNVLAQERRRRQSSRLLFNHLAEALLARVEYALIKDRSCEEFILKRRRVSLLGSKGTPKDKVEPKSESHHAKMRLAEAMNSSVEDAFQHFDKDGNLGLDECEIVSFLSSYCAWMKTYHWTLLQKPRLLGMIDIMCQTLCCESLRPDLEETLRQTFLESIDMSEFESAARNDVSLLVNKIMTSKETLATNLLKKHDKNSDGLLDMKEFATCANLDILQNLGKSDAIEESHYSKLWRTKSALLIRKFCVMLRDVDPPTVSAEKKQDITKSSCALFRTKEGARTDRHEYEEFRTIHRQHSADSNITCSSCAYSGCIVS